MFHIVTLLLFSSIMFAAVYQFWFNKNDMMMVMSIRVCLVIWDKFQLQVTSEIWDTPVIFESCE